jgi:hypothetical protein
LAFSALSGWLAYELLARPSARSTTPDREKDVPAHLFQPHTIPDDVGHYDIDGVSYDNGVIVSSDAAKGFARI